MSQTRDDAVGGAKPQVALDSDPIVERWRDMLRCYSDISCQLERALQDDHGIGMSEFEALDRLVGAHGNNRRMSELAADMYLSQSALSRAVARLERDGLVMRGMCHEDRRAIFVNLTDAGREKHTAARVTQRAVLAEHLT
ncbi:MarR family transcriptional regulator [Actinorhabdospora filicis]|uniref:MarR family transcriptional regulator n=1 Tax=Actinorhabdospora filicis TaxID=1785913 RepID=A0A9W6SIJ0_9ACTN|nr:MarR family transcriptional regulator [Actinorhabdospora filicis]GLZ76602.1 MarR family transcriptional regulator [Actinorhabdospora filicis]